MTEHNWPLRDADAATFTALDKPTRQLILRLLDEPTTADHDALRAHPNGAMLAEWLLSLPAYSEGNDE